MEVLLLGTGAADGIPNAFCGCATCTDYRVRGELRTPTSVLIDGRLLIDPGPESPRQASRLGRDLIGVDAVLVGHAHHDHLDPSFLMHRSWVSRTPLELVGPLPVVERCREWLDPDQTTVRFTEVTSGDELVVAGYRIDVLAANHHALGEAVCYLIADDCSRLLYLTDTGPLPEATWNQLAGRRVDLVLLEETFGHRKGMGEHHHDLSRFAATAEQLRAAGVVDDGSRMVAIHLGHDNPPLADLQVALAELGAEALPDGTVLEL